MRPVVSIRGRTANIYTSTSTASTTLAWSTTTTTTGGTVVIPGGGGSVWISKTGWDDDWLVTPRRPTRDATEVRPRQGLPVRITKGWGGDIQMPDGSVIHVKPDGNFEVNDTNAQVTYRANRNREFNRFINASDLLEQFIDYLGTLGVRQGEVLQVPVELFINWIILEAARADGDPIPAGVAVDHHPALPGNRPRCRCRSCGRFLPRAMEAAGLLFCSPAHYGAFMAKLQVPDAQTANPQVATKKRQRGQHQRLAAPVA